MVKKFSERLYDYFSDVGDVLRGKADASRIFANSTDIGDSREKIYIDFLKQHLPAKCEIFQGGFLFDEYDNESKQIDVIVTTDTAPRYNFNNPSGNGKAFAPVEGCLAVASIKSTLNKAQLIDALEGIASIPPTKELGRRKHPQLPLDDKDYFNWPYKVVYASNGISENELYSHLKEFYEKNSEIPITRRPDIIHVAGKYSWCKAQEGMKIVYPDGRTQDPSPDDYLPYGHPDIEALAQVVNDLQVIASFSTHILFRYGYILNALERFRK